MAGGLTLTAVLALLWPLLRRSPDAAGETAEVAIVRDQLKELERDRARGLIRPEEAAAAKVEVERRLLRAAAAVNATAPVTRRGSRILVVATALLVPLLSVALYLQLGRPTLPDLPLAMRTEAPPSVAGMPDVQDMVARLEERLAAAPDDMQGWHLLGRSRAALGDPVAAVAAFRQAKALAPDERRIDADIAEQIIVEAGGTVTPEARELLEAAAAAGVDDPRPGFYLGLAAAQRGDRDGAAERWKALLAAAPADAPWRDQVVEAIRTAEQQLGMPPVDLPSGSSAEGASTLADIEAMTPEARVAFIRSMVVRLEARLQADGNDAEGWRRLAQSRLVLGDREAAAQAYERGLARFPSDAALLKGYAGLHVAAGSSPDALPAVTEEAARLYERAAAVAPDDPEAQWFLGIRAFQAGRPEEARRHWEKVLTRLEPTDPDYALVKRQLDSLGG
jgi:cytochrome c-type biogenesis protein CcmH